SFYNDPRPPISTLFPYTTLFRSRESSTRRTDSVMRRQYTNHRPSPPRRRPETGVERTFGVRTRRPEVDLRATDGGARRGEDPRPPTTAPGWDGARRRALAYASPRPRRSRARRSARATRRPGRARGSARPR